MDANFPICRKFHSSEIVTLFVRERHDHFFMITGIERRKKFHLIFWMEYRGDSVL